MNLLRCKAEFNPCRVTTIVHNWNLVFHLSKLNENRFVIFIYYECRYAQFALSSTTIYLWLISLTASKELSILLLKLLKCMEQSVYRLIHLGLRVRYRD